MAALAVAGLVIAVLPAAAQSDVLVSAGSPTTPFSQNKQNEPALAVDANHPSILVAGSNDNIDEETCNAGDPTTCPFTQGIGVSGVYFSFDSGASWTQPTYTGWTARDCLGPSACTPHVGPIGTLPWYYENGLVSDGDPGIAFGPKPGPHGFSWSNGSRLYYVNLTSNLGATRSDQSFKGYEAIAVSRTDDVAAAAAGTKSAWMQPVLISQQSSTTFTDKEQVWADNASSSSFFGNAYACWGDFRSNSHGNGSPQPLDIAVSRNGGDTWSVQQVTPATNNPSNQVNGFGRSACTIRTDSHGVAYVFAQQFANGTPGHGYHIMLKSTDGGASWSQAVKIQPAIDDCFFVDPVVGRCMMDGPAGSRDDLSASPSVDLANGAPTGNGATNEIALTWVDGTGGINHQKIAVTTSTNGGNSWTAPVDAGESGDLGYYTAIALSPTGTDAYLTYMAWLQPFQSDTSTPRMLAGVFRHADVSAGTIGAWTTLHRGTPGDARGASQNNLVGEFLGDYVYSVATSTYGAGVWTDVRNDADCPAIDAWRMSNETGGSVPRPSPNADCPASWGNTDIYGISENDPTP
jgi:hypothetical protein